MHIDGRTVCILIGTILCLFSSACTPSPQSKAHTETAMTTFINLDQSTLMPTGLGLSGEGRALATSFLRGVNSNEHFVLSIENWSESGFLILHSHFNGFDRLDGVQVQITRQGNDLIFSVSTPEFPSRPVFTLPGVFSTQSFRTRLRLEIHDGVPQGLRLLVWQDTNPFDQGEIFQRRHFISRGNAAFDSLEEKWIWPGHGRGARWGLSIHHVTVAQAYREAPYVED